MDSGCDTLHKMKEEVLDVDDVKLKTKEDAIVDPRDEIRIKEEMSSDSPKGSSSPELKEVACLPNECQLISDTTKNISELSQTNLMPLDGRVNRGKPPIGALKSKLEHEGIDDETNHNNDLGFYEQPSASDQNQRFACDICKYTCKTASYMRIHVRLHTGHRPFPCKLCDFAATRLPHLKRHMKTHMAVKPYSCEVCDFTCTEQHVLTRHRSGKHSLGETHRCCLCQFACKRKDQLKRHMMIHTGEKPFACEFCDYRCGELSTLKKHVRRHTGEKPYACDLCDYRASESSNLEKHRMMHTGEKPYACNICSYTCRRSTYLREHIKTHSRKTRR